MTHNDQLGAGTPDDAYGTARFLANLSLGLGIFAVAFSLLVLIAAATQGG